MYVKPGVSHEGEEGEVTSQQIGTANEPRHLEIECHQMEIFKNTPDIFRVKGLRSAKTV